MNLNQHKNNAFIVSLLAGGLGFMNIPAASAIDTGQSLPSDEAFNEIVQDETLPPQETEDAQDLGDSESDEDVNETLPELEDPIPDIGSEEDGGNKEEGESGGESSIPDDVEDPTPDPPSSEDGQDEEPEAVIPEETEPEPIPEAEPEELPSTVISFSVPSEVHFEINPNLSSDQQFISSPFVIYNGSEIPLAVSLGAFEQVEGGFIDVAWDAHNDDERAKFGAYRSKQLALGLTPLQYEGDHWIYQHISSPVTAHQLKISQHPVEVGAIEAQSEAWLQLEAQHGASFLSRVQANYRLTFIFELLTETLNVE